MDLVAIERSKKLAALTKGLENDARQMVDPRLNPPIRSPIIRSFWRSHPHLLADLTYLLDAGQLQSPWSNFNDQFRQYLNCVTISRLLSARAQDSASRRDFHTSVRMLRLINVLASRLMSSNKTVACYFAAILLEGISLETVAKVVSTPGFPLSASTQVLSGLPPAPFPDGYLAQAFQRDFQQNDLTKLPDPTSRTAMAVDGTPPDQEEEYRKQVAVGTYDPIETAKTLGKAVKVEMDNARRPLSQFDVSAKTMLEKEASTLPTEPDSSIPDGLSKSWHGILYRFQMNNTRNSLGRKLFFHSTIAEISVIKISCRWRANRDLIRIMLAARIYRASHGGKLPAKTSDFVPLLGAWPLDPFNSKPMIYKPEKEIAYTVGPKLIDNGGDIGDPRRSEVLGVSLKG